MNIAKPYDIPKRLVWDAWKKVKANRGAESVNNETIVDFEKNLSQGLHEQWMINQMGTRQALQVCEAPHASCGMDQGIESAMSQTICVLGILGL